MATQTPSSLGQKAIGDDRAAASCDTCPTRSSRWLTGALWMSAVLLVLAFFAEDPRQLKDDFNARAGSVRLMFIVGPTLGAREEHVSQTIPLLRGPSVFHYWDEIGYSGRHYENRLDIGIYAWDVWMIYGPDALWIDELPPAPAFWRHQLSSLVDATRLNPEVFHGEADKLLAALDAEPGAFLARR